MIESILQGEDNKVFLQNRGNEPREQLKQALSSLIVGQDKAKEAIIDSLLTNLTSLIPKKGTLGTFMFCGSSGVGKTEMIRALTELLLGHPDRFTRINCENLSESHMGASLIGSPPGYIGYGKDPMLGENVYNGWKEAHNKGEVSAMIRRFPLFSIILFDEIEKAHPKVHQSLLGLMDSGELKLANGDTMDLGNALIFMTSNIGEREVREVESKNTMGFVKQDKTTDVQNAFKESLKMFSPEFINRIDSVIRFDKLTEEDCKAIIDIKLRKINEFLEQSNTKMQLKLTPGVYRHLLALGYSENTGARNIERVFQKEINAKFGEVLGNNTELLEQSNYKISIYAEIRNGQIIFSISKKGIEEIKKEIRGRLLTLHAGY